MATTRRQFLAGMAGVATLGAAGRLGAATTPWQMAGPFYPDQPLPEDDFDLTQVPGSPLPAQGQITDLQGRLLDQHGRIVANSRIEIWQCDAKGRFRHSRDPASRSPDTGFQGKGSAWTDNRGHYRFRTIRPVAYPGRTPHIHVAVHISGNRPFTTQLYVAGESGNAEDILYRRIPADKRPLLTAEFRKGENGLLQADWDIILDIAQS